MIKQHAIALIIACSFSFAAPWAAAADFPKYGFSIELLDETPSMQAPTSAVITFLPPTSDFAPNINVVIQPYDKDIKAYAELSKGQFRQLGWEIISEDLVSPSEWVFEYRGEMNGNKLHFYARAISDGKKVYLATATAKRAQWDAVKTKLIKHVQSLKLD